MASLNKLAIRGIRSFDDKQISVIEFFSPVTVIVGHNGSGKTTIIECLKYATTGDQPPNTRGGAFVHDPKMANEKEVKAQVKLRFHAANGTRMLAVRNLSVTMKKTSGMTMKTLESILGLADGNADKGGKRGVISTKCAEMDAEIPALLGVSKSVLENVIFCHQEDSYWPLAEPAALKKKFDDIFEATRYTKALDSIKALRKDRVADLKAEKERLESLSREKSHSDKLRARIADMSSTIATKEVDYEDTKQQYEDLVKSNAQFYNYSTKFREMYIKIENLQERKKRYQDELEESKESIQEVEGTDDELAARLRNFDRHISEQKQVRKTRESKKEDLEEELARARKSHVEANNHLGELQHEAKAKQRVQDREKLISEISRKHSMKGYDHTPLEREKVVEFLARLNELQRKQRAEYEKLQTESRTKTEEHNTKFRGMQTALDSLKIQRQNNREQAAMTQKKISTDESKLDEAETLTSDLRTLVVEMEDNQTRLDKIKHDFENSGYEAKLVEKASRTRALEDQRNALTAEIRVLSLQADSRARLDLKRAEVKTKSADITNTLANANEKFKKISGSDAQADTIERELDHISADIERQDEELESEAAAANKKLQQAEITLSSLKNQLKAKIDELKANEKKLRDANIKDLKAQIEEANREIDERKELSGQSSGASGIYENLLKLGKQSKSCSVCSRHMNTSEMAVFEKYLKEQIQRNSPESIANEIADLNDWVEELAHFQKMLPVQATRDRLKLTDIPALEKEIQVQEAEIPAITTKAEMAKKLLIMKKQLKELSAIKQQSIHITKTQKEIARLSDEIATLENDLRRSGSAKTADDVQAELDEVASQLRTNEREKTIIMAERDRQNTTQRSLENLLHELQMRENDLKNRIREKESLEVNIASMKKDIVTFNARLKELDGEINEAQGPIEQMEQDYKQAHAALNTKIEGAQRLSQELNMNVDNLNSLNKGVERYVRDKRAKALKDCIEMIDSIEQDIQRFVTEIEDVREGIAKLDKEINESGASVSNLRENLRLRKLVRDITATQEEIDSYDMEEAAKAKRNFEEQYNVKKTQESELQSKYAHIAGELSSDRSLVKTWEGDLKEYKDINQKYTQQLIKVKMSDMANSDLEKYGKALDNAIMKYHGLKMEELNDTMRHLWNKTYQGTDIDGIKIRSDVEGGASKRSYNYRVVMTKDQVEMDMRGRCSAGQKMLASIIIRLALSDSFGQNCGILALDEPTNALDTENIDALAASLVDIINERKNHSNFQLIIITHDENFLRKLGQSDVMEYYWRVSRDSRQKSVIERQRFR
ncbi:hypothetical protein HWV62_291 [Athelia sp. TMB]|nr:hypothetical protein HWV62_291 [Athelia sp. TMB]